MQIFQPRISLLAPYVILFHTFIVFFIEIFTTFAAVTHIRPPVSNTSEGRDVNTARGKIRHIVNLNFHIEV